MSIDGIFKDKVVWITGASSGIGEELSIQLDQLGAKLILSSRNKDRLTVLKSSLHQQDQHMVLPLDLSKSDEFETLLGQVVSKYGGVDLVIQNGGISQRGTAAESSEAVIRRIMEVNFFGNVLLTKQVLPELRKTKGQILVISSIAGKFGFFFVLRNTLNKGLFKC